jgi:hypothetical protein
MTIWIPSKPLHRTNVPTGKYDTSAGGRGTALGAVTIDLGHRNGVPPASGCTTKFFGPEPVIVHTPGYLSNAIETLSPILNILIPFLFDFFIQLNDIFLRQFTINDSLLPQNIMQIVYIHITPS